MAEQHNPTGQIPDARPVARSSRPAIPTWYFVLVVVRLGHRFLVVHERTHGQGWYLPAGRVEPGEAIVRAAERETLEETGMPIAVDGIIRIEHTPQGTGSARVRFIVAAHPLDDTPPKRQPDEESLGAAWVTLDELEQLPMRGTEVREVFRHVAAGGVIYPLSLLATEDTAYS